MTEDGFTSGAPRVTPASIGAVPSVAGDYTLAFDSTGTLTVEGALMIKGDLDSFGRALLFGNGLYLSDGTYDPLFSSAGLWVDGAALNTLAGLTVNGVVRGAGFADTAAAFTTPTISGTAVQLSTTVDKRLFVPVTFNPTAIATATCDLQISPDDVTYTTVYSRLLPIGTVFAGSVDSANLLVPAGWYVKTANVSNATVGTCKAW